MPDHENPGEIIEAVRVTMRVDTDMDGRSWPMIQIGPVNDPEWARLMGEGLKQLFITRYLAPFAMAQDQPRT